MTPERDTPALELAKTLMVDKEVNPRVFNRVWMRRVAAALIDTSTSVDAITALVKVERDAEANKYVAEFGDMVSSGDTAQQAIVNVLRCADLQLRHELAAGKVLRDSLRSVSARLERARVAIENQICAPNCQSRARVPFSEKSRGEQDRNCNCWKSQALADIPAAPKDNKCNCVCHSASSSRASCSHCRGINEVSDLHLKRRITELESDCSDDTARLDWILSHAIVATELRSGTVEKLITHRKTIDELRGVGNTKEKTNG